MNAHIQLRLHRLGLMPRPAAAVPAKPALRVLRPSPAPHAGVYCDPYITPQRRPRRRLAIAAVGLIALAIALVIAVIR